MFFCHNTTLLKNTVFEGIETLDASRFMTSDFKSPTDTNRCGADQATYHFTNLVEKVGFSPTNTALEPITPLKGVA